MRRQIKFRVLAAVIVILATSINADAQLGGALNRTRRAVEQTAKETEQTGEDVSKIPLQASVSGNISAGNFVNGTVATVTFNRFPANVNEWKQVRDQIGETIPGAVALQIMACELYRRNSAAGTECLILNTVSSSQTSYTSLLMNVASSRPYQFAAYLKGASWDNGYNPTKPYTIEIRVTATSAKDYATYYQADSYKFFIKSNGHELNGGLQPVSVLKTERPGEPGEGGKYYIVHGSSSIFLQCKEKKFSESFNGLD